MSNKEKMKKLHIVYGGWLSAPNGVSSLISEINNNSDSFLKGGLDLEVHSLDRDQPRDFEAASSESRDNIFKAFVKKHSRRSKVLSAILVYGLFIRHAKAGYQ